MSTGRRAYDLLRGYVNHEWERIRGADEASALKELNEYVPPAKPAEQIKANPMDQVPPKDRKGLASKVLGVPEGAPFKEVKKAFDHLHKRTDSHRFPEGSAERERAGEIRRKVEWAYRVLTEGMDPTQVRFSSLEIE